MDGSINGKGKMWFVSKLKKVKKRRFILSFSILFLITLVTTKSLKKVYPQDIFIYGSNSLSSADILKNSSLNFPMPLLFVKTKYIEQQLKKNLSLKNVSVTRQIFPFGLRIFIQTREPIAYGEKIKNGKKVKGYIDKYGFFIDEKYTDKKYLRELSTSIFGWKTDYIILISKILNYSNEYSVNFQTINFSPNGFLILEEVTLKKIILGNDTKLIENQLNTIVNIKNKLTDEEFLEKIDTIDITDPKNPKIKVFKP